MCMPAGGNRPIARLEPDDAAIGRRADHRAAGLRADRQRHHEIGDRRGRAARRAAGRVQPDYAGCEVGAGMAVGELGGDRLAQQDRAGGARQAHGAGVETRPAAGIDRRAVAGRHVGGIEDVLDAERHALQQPGCRASLERAAASAASPSRWAQARTTGSRSRMRSRQLCTTASAVRVPSSISPAKLVADRRCGSTFCMAETSGCRGRALSSTALHPATPLFRGRELCWRR